MQREVGIIIQMQSIACCANTSRVIKISSGLLNALAALYLDNYNQRISGPDNVTDAKLKGDPRAWQQFTAAVNADLRFTPLSAEAVTGGTLKNVFNTRIAGNADLLGQLYIKKRSVRLSRTNRPIAEMMNIGYLKESDEGFKFLGRLWHDYGEAGTAPSGPRATHPALRLSKKFWPMFGQNKPHARYFDDARRRFTAIRQRWRTIISTWRPSSGMAAIRSSS
jgi:hypothetical protein